MLVILLILLLSCLTLGDLDLKSSGKVTMILDKQKNYETKWGRLKIEKIEVIDESTKSENSSMCDFPSDSAVKVPNFTHNSIFNRNEEFDKTLYLPSSMF